MILNRLFGAASVRVWTLCSIAAIGIAGSVGCATLGPGCGCGIASSCGGEVGCAVEPGCGCDVGCGVEPGCGCGSTCGCDGRSMAGQRWCGDCGCGPNKPLINVCRCDGGCGCGVEPGCGCEPSCGGEVGCGSVCGGGCGCGDCPIVRGVGYGLGCIGAEFRRLLSPLGLCCPGGGCGGCGDLYWNEWHSEPPRCCDPCDHCGNWVGPSSSTSMRAPYDHEFAPRRIATLPGTGNQVR